MQLLPPHSTELEKALVKIFYECLEEKTLFIEQLWDADQSPESLLVYLANFLSVDFKIYNTLTLEEKRAYIKQSIEIHRKKGTLGALRKALAPIELATSITEWYENDKEPHTIRVNVRPKDRDSDNLAPFKIDQLRTIVQQTKNVQTQFYINIHNETEGKPYAGAASRNRLKINVIDSFSDTLAEFNSINQQIEDFTWLE